MKKLDVNNFNTIRYSVFCGEAITYETAALWKKAAPKSVIDNLYGPTEATVAITGYLWNEESGSGILPIGHPFFNQKVHLLNKNNQEVKQGEIGEICLAGTQICDKYWNNEAVTSSCFLNYQGQRIYKTGDLAYWDEKNGLCYKGRIDDQLKINGHRIEKLDIENRLKAILKTQAVSVIAFNDKQTGAVKYLNCFFSDVNIDEIDAIKLCRQMLPDSMIPARVIKLDQFPYNKNGKIDYPYLYRLASLETQASQ
jgi:acyl-coenzyme A synthetase/AMP-(fatty) acid ligase